MNKFTYHDYDKKTKSCRICGRKFKSIPKEDDCPGLEIRMDKKNETTENMLELLNRHLKPDAKPIAYQDNRVYTYSKKRDLTRYIYSLKDTLITDKTLPRAYKNTQDMPRNPISLKQMKEEKLEPKPDTKPIGIIGNYGLVSGTMTLKWEYYYDKKDTQSGDGLNYITKKTLKSEYSLSEGWIKKLGEPDKIVPNPHYKKSPPMKLYQLLRVRKFLKDNADEYSEWLVKRDKMVLNHRSNLALKGLYIQKLKYQNKLCLKCKFSTFSDDGVLCKMHPTGFPADVPNKRYCPDYENN